MTRTRRHHPQIVTALYVNAGLLLAILVTVITTRSTPEFLPAAFGQNQAPIAGGSGLYVMPAQLHDRIWGCYLLDSDNQTLSCYQYWPGERVLRLVAARSIQHDHRLKNFNTEPDPEFVKSMVEKEAQALRASNKQSGETPKE